MHDLSNFFLLQMLDCKCALADGIFVQLFLNSLLCCHDDLELSVYTEHLILTNALREKWRDADFLPDCNVYGTLASFLASGSGFLPGNNCNSYIV